MGGTGMGDFGAMGTAGLVLSLISAGIMGTSAYFVFRAIGKEKATLGKIALGVGGVSLGLTAVGSVLAGLGIKIFGDAAQKAANA